jgi:hypothetical protein
MGWCTGPVTLSNGSGRDWRCGLVAGELGHRSFGTVVVDQGFAGGGGSDECGDGGVVERARQAEAGLMEPSDGIVGDLSRAQDYAEPRGDLNCRCRYLSA